MPAALNCVFMQGVKIVSVLKCQQSDKKPKHKNGQTGWQTGRRNILADRERGQKEKKKDELRSRQTCCTTDLSEKPQICKLSE